MKYTFNITEKHLCFAIRPYRLGDGRMKVICKVSFKVSSKNLKQAVSEKFVAKTC